MTCLFYVDVTICFMSYCSTSSMRDFSVTCSVQIIKSSFPETIYDHLLWKLFLTTTNAQPQQLDLPLYIFHKNRKQGPPASPCGILYSYSLLGLGVFFHLLFYKQHTLVRMVIPKGWSAFSPCQLQRGYDI